MEWNGQERRNATHDKLTCPNEDRFIRIEEDAANHKDWRKETSSVLGDIHIQLATLNERLKYKTDQMDDHIQQGKVWRGSLFAISVTVLLNIAGTIWWASTVNEKIFRMEQLHPYGSPVAAQPKI